MNLRRSGIPASALLIGLIYVGAFVAAGHTAKAASESVAVTGNMPGELDRPAEGDPSLALERCPDAPWMIAAIVMHPDDVAGYANDGARSPARWVGRRARTLRKFGPLENTLPTPAFHPVDRQIFF